MVEAVRPARREDAPACAELCRRALAELDSLRGGPLFARRETGLVAKALLRPGGLDRLLSQALRTVLVATIDDVVVALAIGHVDDVGEAVLGVVDACYVEVAARGVGLGAALLENLVAVFEAAGCRGVDVPALPGDRNTKNLLESVGFKARLITMHRAFG
jgi:GNAT superfamily N-acetyltransferase